ncbi:MAG: hypothetical protein AAF367_03500 [Pseudomonadota bacterium]
MKRFTAIATAIALSASAASAFSFIDNVTRDYVDPNYYPIDASVFAGGGGRTTIVGTTRDGASAEEIAANIRLPSFLSQRTVRAATEPQKGLHMVLVFAPQSGTTPRKACSGQAKGGQAGDTLKVMGVFCSGSGKPLSEALYTANGSPVPSDPDFQRRMSILIKTILPVRNPETQGD